MTEATLALPAEETPERAPAGPWRIALRRLLRKRIAVVAMVVVTLFYLMGLFAPAIAPKDYRDQNLERIKEGPSLDYPLGTDANGRDMLSRIIWASRTTVIVTIATVVTGGLVLAVGLGMLSGYAGGKTDTAIMRTGEVFASLPGLPLLILINTTMRFRVENATNWLESHISSEALQDALEARSGPEFVFIVVVGVMAIVGLTGLAAWLLAGEERRTAVWLVPGIVAAIIVLSLWVVQGIFATGGAEDYFLVFGALALFSWVGGARVIRSQVLSLRETEYVLAARAMGASTWRIITSHLLPNVSPIIIVSVSAGLGAIAATEVALTFLGVGIHDPTPSLGAMIFEGSNVRSLDETPHLLLFPGLVIAALIFSFNLLGDALNDVLTPRAR
jgi:ABC-type dipeptide/oligopeptide/nickel transport system permease subunit